MKKLVALLLSLCLVLGCVAFASADGYTPGVYGVVAQGFGGDVRVEITVDENAITDVVITGDSETPTVGGAAIPELVEQIKACQSAEFDGVDTVDIELEYVKSQRPEAPGCPECGSPDTSYYDMVKKVGGTRTCATRPA